MKACILPIVLVLLIAAAASVAQDDKPPMDLLVYPGAETTMEVNLAAEDIPPMLQAALPMVTRGKPGLAEVLKPEDLAEMLKDVRRVQFLQMDVMKSATVQQIAEWYTKRLPSGKWSRVYYASDSEAITAIYADPAQDTYYGFRTQKAKIDDRQVKQINVAKLVGRIDFAKLVSLAAKVFAAQAAPSG